MRQIELPGVFGQVGDDDDCQYADDGAGHAIEHLRDDEKTIGIGEGEHSRADRRQRESDQQQRFAPALLGMIADPGRQHRHDDLRHDDESGHPKRRLHRYRRRQIFSDQWQHRRVRQLEQHQSRGEQDQPVIFQEVGDASNLRRAMAAAGIASAGIVNLLRPDQAERDQRRYA